VKRFSEPGRRALVLAADEARSLGHDRIGSEHLLLGLVRLGDAATAALGLTLDRARDDVRGSLGPGSGARTIGELRFTAAASRVLDGADRISGPDGATPSDLLSALLGERGSGAADILDHAGELTTDNADDADDVLALAADPRTVTARALRRLGVDERRLRDAVGAVRRDG
jgi:ATP-dependent Clp protease ATP-binding subunit ClpA